MTAIWCLLSFGAGAIFGLFVTAFAEVAHRESEREERELAKTHTKINRKGMMCCPRCGSPGWNTTFIKRRYSPVPEWTVECRTCYWWTRSAPTWWLARIMWDLGIGG